MVKPKGKTKERFNGHYHYMQGKTLVRTMGQYFGLYNTFEGTCQNAGDEIADTKAEAYPYFKCPEWSEKPPITCGDDIVDPIHNFMDYRTTCACALSPQSRPS